MVLLAWHYTYFFCHKVHKFRCNKASPSMYTRVKMTMYTYRCNVYVCICMNVLIHPYGYVDIGIISMYKMYVCMYQCLHSHRSASRQGLLNKLNSSLQRGKTPNRASMIWNYTIWWWCFSNTGALGNAEFPFIAITLRPTLTLSGNAS